MNQFEDDQGLSDEEGPQFNNLVVDKNTGRVYIGAVNKLYQLSPNLEPMVSKYFLCSAQARRLETLNSKSQLANTTFVRGCSQIT